MNCPHCLQHVPDGSAFCPYCGARVGEPEPGALPEATEDPTYGALAQANLLRLRGDWNAAREKTVAVLREYPNSGTAHSLMGDIFADQDMYEDAAQWYRMALELEPDNAADERKLAAAEARVAEKENAGREPSEEAPPAISGFRVAAWAAGAFLVLVIALGVWLTQMNPRGRQELPSPEPRATQPPPGAAPPTQPDVPATSAPGAQPPAASAPAPSRVEPPAAPEPANGGSSAAVFGETQGEAGLRAQLSTLGDSLAADGLRLADLQIDPRTQSATVTLDGSGVDGSAAGWMEGVHRGALAVAARAFHADKALARVRIRVVMPLATPEGVVRDVAFIADAARPAGFDTVPNAALAHFDRRWWRPGLTPPPELAATP